MICTWVMMAQLFAISIVRGNGDDTDGGIKKCSPIDWVLFSLLIVNTIIMEVVAILLIKRQNTNKIAAGYKFLKGDI